ncbi:adenosylcobinamide-phosphate synthase CbiB [Sphingopyxis sp. MWB1]|uniref:adenosylcobinamide-phosphate synthase CbiB n=1 Tax=Sphingopyxis sp. MWB1 TaxID=1537715 RepID=UPI00051A786C|nr:adenosylcobinamide-phosphate synthase CbiB [Sphingopyxis sp. MWB1]
MAEPVALAAMALDAVFGWPAPLYRRIGHPVGLFARWIHRCEARWNRASYGNGARRLFGLLTLLMMLIVVGGAGWGLQALAARFLPAPLGSLVVALLAWPALAQRSLFDHVRAVAAPLSAGESDKAREAVAAIVGRDTARLDESGIARAAIESLAESFCDGVVAPLFWLLVAGLPGIWIYKAVNTADSLIGHREPRWRAFGWASARLDDGLNFLPARAAALSLLVASLRDGWRAGMQSWRVMRRDARRHASPNAGWPEAAMAGALGVRLAGPIAYDGVKLAKPWIGSEGRTARGEDIDRALRLYIRACLLLWLMTGGWLWLLA